MLRYCTFRLVISRRDFFLDLPISREIYYFFKHSSFFNRERIFYDFNIQSENRCNDLFFYGRNAEEMEIVLSRDSKNTGFVTVCFCWCWADRRLGLCNSWCAIGYASEASSSEVLYGKKFKTFALHLNWAFKLVHLHCRYVWKSEKTFLTNCWNGAFLLRKAVVPLAQTRRMRWRFFACKVGFLLQDRTKFGTAGLFLHAKSVYELLTLLYTLTTATIFNAAA